MKLQVRKNVLTHKWEVQKQEQPPKWEKVAEFVTKEQADRYALNAQKKSNKPSKAKTKK